MLEKALAEDPDNSDVQIALAALLMRGVQMVWLSPAEREAAETRAEAILQQTLRAKPNHIPAHEAYCRFLNATNQFRASLVACARALSFDPWNGIALYHVGLAQIQTGRFEDALATFQQADRFDTPQVSRWTWMIGAGWANLLMGRDEDAVPWLQKSIAITSASGRTHMLLAAAYQRLGKTDEAQSGDGKGPRIAAGLDRSQCSDADEECQPGLSRGSRTDHAVDGGGGVAGGVGRRPARETDRFLSRRSWKMLFKPASPHKLLTFCNARCIIAEEEKPYGQKRHPAHRHREQVREARRRPVEPNKQLGKVLQSCPFDDALKWLRARRRGHALLLRRIGQTQGFKQLSPCIRQRFGRRDQDLKCRAVLTGKMREVKAEQAEEGDPPMGMALELVIPII